MKIRTTLLTVFFTLLVFLTTKAQDCNDDIHDGEGTYYEGLAGTSDGNCSLPVDSNDFMYCALNTIDYDNSNACGGWIMVTGPQGTVMLKVVNRCPECEEGDVDMTEQAFSQIADINDGRVPISWRYIPADIDQTIKISFKPGSSQFWTAIQFRNIKHSISKMEYQKEYGSWQAVDRTIYNYFVESSGIPSPMNIKVTSVLGEELIFENVSLNLSSEYDTGLQFATPDECLESLTISAFESTSFILYPNPTLDIVNIEGKEIVDNWILRDYAGKRLYKGNSDQINMSSLSEGIYFLQLNNQIAKVIKQ